MKRTISIMLLASALIGCGHSVVSHTPVEKRDIESGAWTPYGGDWAFAPGRISNASSERGAKLINTLSDSGDFQVEADISLAEADGEAGFLLRTSGEEEGLDSYHGYFAGVRATDTSLEFGRADFGWRPLLRRGLPASVRLDQPLHLKVIAVGCRFGLELTFSDGKKAAALADDPQCVPRGHFGLRSILTSTIWSRISIASASSKDLESLADNADALAYTHNIAMAEPFDQDTVQRYVSSFRTQAAKHELQPGAQVVWAYGLSPGRHPDVTIQGTIISTVPLVGIQDGTGSLLVANRLDSAALKLGDVVEARGTIVSEQFRSSFADVRIKVLWSDKPVPPLAVTAAQLANGTYRGRPITVEGMLVSSRSYAGGYDFVLRDGDLEFRALGYKDLPAAVSSAAPGSRLRLQGVATSLPQFTEGIYPFGLLTQQFEIINSPPWWSFRHIVMLALACLSLLFVIQHLFHRIQRWQLRSVLQQREQLAFDMHDTLAQSFTGIAYQLQAAAVEEGGNGVIQDHVQSALKMVYRSHREASRTIATFRPQHRDAAGLVSELKDLAQRLVDGGELSIHAAAQGASVELPLEVTDALFRVGQEAIANAIQHGRCHALSIELHMVRREVQLVIEDDGIGFLLDDSSEGLGLTAMRTRAEKIGATLEIRPGPEMGTIVSMTVHLPFARGLWENARGMLRDTFGKSLQ